MRYLTSDVGGRGSGFRRNLWRLRAAPRVGFDSARTRLGVLAAQPIANAFTRAFVYEHSDARRFAAESSLDVDRRMHWLGVPTWKFPLDAWVLQEIVSETRPELIIETGTFEGGSALFFASICDALGVGLIATIDTDTARIHQRVRAHDRIQILEGRSTDPAIVSSIQRLAENRRTMVVLDSDHACENVLAELDVFAPLVSHGCYLVVEDTGLGHLYLPFWGSALEAVSQWLPDHPEFKVDRAREKFRASTSPGGFIRRMSERP